MDNKLYRQMRLDFSKRYNKYLLPRLRGFEYDRVQARKKLFTRLTSVLTIGVIFCLVLILKAVGLDKTGDLPLASLIITLQPVLLIVFFLIVYVNVDLFGTKKKFENKLKERFLDDLCKCLGDIKWYYGDYDKPITAPIEKTCIFSSYNRMHCDDRFEGTYKDVKYELIESRFTYVRSSGKNSSTDKIFSGLIVIIDMHKDFDSHTVLRPRGEHKDIPKILRRTVMEDIVFEKNFDVFTNDEVDARYLITTAFMNRLNNIQKIFKAQKVSCAFYNKELYIALHTEKDLFKLFDIHKPIDNYQQFMVFFDEILSIYKCIDCLKLDKKLKL